MKNLLTKFRISSALDARRPLPESIQADIEASPGLRDFAEGTEALDHALRRAPGAAPGDSSLHDSIMRAVRAAAAEKAPRRGARFLWLAPASAFAVVAAIGLWLGWPRPVKPLQAPGTPALAAVSAAFEMSGEMSQTMPAEVIAPLSNEWAQVDSDVRGATQFVLSRLP
jgi:hypothetical protein